MRERGLKLAYDADSIHPLESLPMRERGLKLQMNWKSF